MNPRHLARFTALTFTTDKEFPVALEVDDGDIGGEERCRRILHPKFVAAQQPDVGAGSVIPEDPDDENVGAVRGEGSGGGPLRE